MTGVIGLSDDAYGKFYVYRITVNSNIYIGVSKNPKTRFKYHKKTGRIKHLLENTSYEKDVDIIYTTNNVYSALLMEMYYIWKNHSIVLNQSIGGEYPNIVPLEYFLKKVYEVDMSIFYNVSPDELTEIFNFMSNDIRDRAEWTANKPLDSLQSKMYMYEKIQRQIENRESKWAYEQMCRDEAEERERIDKQNYGNGNAYYGNGNG